MIVSTPLILTQRPVTIVIALMVISSISFFLTFPYLALYITSQFGLSPAHTGAIVGFVTLIAAGGGWFGGRLVDQIGPRRIVLWASALYGTGYVLLFITTTLALEVLALIVVGVARMLMEPALKAMIVRLGGASGQLFRIRYLILVVSAAVAPLCVAFVPMEQFAHVFLAAAGLHAVGAIVGFSDALTDTRARGQTSTRDGAAALPARFTVALISLSGLAFLTVFSQLETNLPLHLLANNPQDGLELYRYILLANALIALAMVFFVEAVGWDTTRPGWIAVGTLALGAAVTCLFLGDQIWVIAAGVVLFTIAEVLLFPLPDIFAARIAKPGSEGRLMGLVDIRHFGFFVGPTLGGVALTAGPNVLAASLAAISLMLLPLFLWIHSRAS